MSAPSTPPAPVASTPTVETFKFRWDVLLFFGFLVAAAPEPTGIAIHEWLSLALVAVLVIHLALNWAWIVGTSRRMFARLPGEVRFNHVLDGVLFVAMTLTVVSGLMESNVALPQLGLGGPRDYFWQHVHGIFAYTTVAIVGAHLGMHVRWIAARLKRAPRAVTVGSPIFTPSFARRAAVVVLVALVVGWAGLQLGRTPWAEGSRANNERFMRELAVRTPPRQANPPRAPSRRNVIGRVVQPVLAVVALLGLPAGATFAALRYTERRNDRSAS